MLTSATSAAGGGACMIRICKGIRGAQNLKTQKSGIITLIRNEDEQTEEHSVTCVQ